jgi:hypothetical protein
MTRYLFPTIKYTRQAGDFADSFFRRALSRLDRISVADPYYGEKNLGLYFGQSEGVGLMLSHRLASK